MSVTVIHNNNIIYIPYNNIIFGNILINIINTYTRQLHELLVLSPMKVEICSPLKL